MALSAALYCAGGLRHALFGAALVPQWAGLLVLFWVIGAHSRGLLPGWGLGAPEELRRLTSLVVTTFGVTTLVLFLLRQGADQSRLVLGVGFFVAWPLIVLTRNLTKQALIRAGIWGAPTVVYGSDEVLIKALQENPGFGYRPVGIFCRMHERGSVVCGIPVIGCLEEATPVASVAIVASLGATREELVRLLDGPVSRYRTALVVPDLFEVQSLWAQTRDVGGVLGLELTRNLLDPAARFGKRAFDLVGVLLSALFWVPLCLLLALLIWREDRANPLFLQQRVGRHGRMFRTWKFRTMVPDAEGVLQRRLAEDSVMRAEWEANFKLKDDPRITRIGNLLRRTSLDELPQLVNVVKGEMSLVGPRPLPRYHAEELPESTRELRARVRPGMTGLWQVSGRSDSGTAGMDRWDPYYVRNWSIWLDLVILVRTVRVVLRGSGAY